MTWTVPWCTERLKARSYAQAAVELCPQAVSETEVVEAFKDLVGLSRQEVATALMATMSHCEQVQWLLRALNMVQSFDFVATRDDVDQGKPDPEIYQLVAQELDVTPAECLVVEDSVFGVKAALAAGMWCIAATTPFTRRGIHAEQVLDARWIVDDPDMLATIVRQMVAEQKGCGAVS